MLLNIILGVVVIISLAIIIFIIIRKFPRLKSLDVETVPEEKTAQVRDRILMERMKRSTKKSREVIQKKAIPLWTNFVSFVKAIFRKVYELEKKYQKEASGNKKVSSGEQARKAKGIIKEAAKFLKQEKYNEAEKLYIEVVSVDPKNQTAYEGLQEVYISTKEYQQALQTAEFILRLALKKGSLVEKQNEFGQMYKTYSNANEVSGSYFDIGEIYEMMGNTAKAMENFQKALELEPNNPKNIDQTLELAIKVKDKSLAVDLVKKLESVNPNNQKLKDYQEKIQAL